MGNTAKTNLTKIEDFANVETKYRVEPVGELKGKPVYFFLKRTMDIILSLVALIVLIVPMILVAILIMIDSPGNPIFSQVRLGENQKPFTLYKFRSMRLDAEKDGIQWAAKNDDRTTRVGKFIRKTRIDELPQLVNILKGDMSIVGPRPERPEFYDVFDSYIFGFRQRMMVKPGLTGYAQVVGGYSLLPEEKIIYDMEYIKNCSILFDIKMILKTVAVVIVGDSSRDELKDIKACQVVTEDPFCSGGVSVVIPAYNAEKTVAETIKSVLSQTYKDYEIIVVDDCSKDSTWEILQGLKEENHRIKIFQNPENKGVAYSRNFGVSKAKNCWIAFLDSDDVWKEDKLQKQMDLIFETTSDVCYTGYDFMAEDGTKLKGGLKVPESVRFHELLKQNIMSCSGIVLKKELIEQVKMEKDHIHEDFLAWLRILQRGAKAVGINEPLHTLRVAVKTSKSGNKFKSAIMTYNTYKELGISLPKRIYYFFHYVNRNLKKYGQISR